jgi:hypothetical protein
VIDRMVSDARVLLSESVAFVAICSNDAARNNPPHIPERANNKSNVQHSTAPHLANQSEMMTEFCVLSIQECGVTLKIRLRILSRRAEKRRSAHSQMEENAHGECPGQWTGANIRGRSLNAAHVVLAR